MQRLVLTMLLAFTIGAKSSSGQPLSEAGFEMVTERVYLLSSLETQQLDTFLASEAYPFLPEQMHNTCRDTAFLKQSDRDEHHVCISGKIFRSRLFPNLIFSLVKDVNGSAFILWDDTPFGLYLVRVFLGDKLTRDIPLTLMARYSAERSNSSHEGRFLEELRLEFDGTSLIYANYNTYGLFNIGHGPNGSTSNHKIQENWVMHICDACNGPVIEIPLLESK